jgi:phosphoenolpyruvate carboxykinase (ATP)
VTEPKETFSTCFGAPFLPLNPNVYAQMLGKKIAKHGSAVWLVNTGWTGGPYGVGSRMKIAYTRAMITAALTGQLASVGYERHPVFNIEMPTSCPGVPASVLNPRNTWPEAERYDAQAKKLAQMFIENFKKFENDVPASVKQAGPSA